MSAQSLKPVWHEDIEQNVAARMPHVDTRIDIHSARKPIGVATCEITKRLSKTLLGQLPQPEVIAALLEGMEE